ncbi:hypothetical protein [Alteromonas antoniana]|uniref:hypothetical protein n=1 Tax=Alteromonas antoniana TaxID=2803813 RepID=UPI001C44C8D2|nr:hypothetical protein [Alteromonas antoniana]
MAEPNSTITNVLAVAIALTAIGTGGEPQSDARQGKRVERSVNTPVLSEQSVSAKKQYASLLSSAYGGIERHYSQAPSEPHNEMPESLRVISGRAIPDEAEDYGFISALGE